VNIYNIKMARMSDEEVNTDEETSEILAIEKSSSLTVVEQKKS
jgi:hypothetical protein